MSCVVLAGVWFTRIVISMQCIATNITANALQRMLQLCCPCSSATSLSMISMHCNECNSCHTNVRLVAMVYNESALHSMSCIVIAGVWFATKVISCNALQGCYSCAVHNESISGINALQRVQQLPYLVAMVYNESALHSMCCIDLAGAWFATKVISMQCIATSATAVLSMQ